MPASNQATTSVSRNEFNELKNTVARLTEDLHGHEDDPGACGDITELFERIGRIEDRLKKLDGQQSPTREELGLGL